jgi:tRNA threonylcarbamoyladenosine biosynthesis protein TsaE
MNNQVKIDVKNLSETKNLAQKIAALIDSNDTLTLKGDLGAGKTTFCSLIIQQILPIDNNVTSPTFNIVHQYKSDNINNNISIWHFDLYRLKHINEIFELGYEEALEDIMLIEWPEIIDNLLPKDRLEIAIIFENSDNRKYILTPFGKWEKKLMEMRYD